MLGEVILKSFYYLVERFMDTIEKQIVNLRESIRQHNYCYYSGNPVIPDEEFDNYMSKLVALEKDFPRYFDENSPTQRLGTGLPTTFDKVNHRHKMLSLSNAYTCEDVTKFLGRGLPLVAEGKIDGMSLSLIYHEGKLKRAITRGDGTTGDDVTNNARTIRSIPLILNSNFSFEVRGEVIMRRSIFEKIKEESEEEFANPRNAASGTMRNKYSTVVSSRKLDFVAYDIIGTDADSRSQRHIILEEAGFPFTPRKLPAKDGIITVNCETESVEKLCHFYQNSRDSFDFDIDGVVFKIDSIRISEEKGSGTKFPKWAIAYKYPPERKKAILRDITISIGRHGTLTPVAHFDGVSLSGTIVRKASLCNKDEVERLGINIGDEVFIEKSAEIIPKVVGLSKKGISSDFWVYPSACPFCNSKLEYDTKVAVRCRSIKCEEQIVQRVYYALSKHALNFDGIGEKHVRELVNIGVSNLSDIYTLSEERVLPILKKAATKVFFKCVESSKTLPLWRKLCALGIEGIGKSSSQDLATKYNSLERILEAGDEVKSVVGDIHGNSLILFLKSNIKLVCSLIDSGVIFEDCDVSGLLAGKTFVVTGKMEQGSRDDFILFIENNGGVVKSSVSKKVDFLVMGEDPGGNKTQGAQRHGTTIITEYDLLAMSGKKSIC